MLSLINHSTLLTLSFDGAGIDPTIDSDQWALDLMDGRGSKPGTSFENLGIDSFPFGLLPSKLREILIDFRDVLGPIPDSYSVNIKHAVSSCTGSAMDSTEKSRWKLRLVNLYRQ